MEKKEGKKKKKKKIEMKKINLIHDTIPLVQ